jgi:ribonuclease HI
MIVKIIVCASEKYYSVLLTAGDHQKKLKGPMKEAAELENVLRSTIKAIKMLKYPVDIELVTDYEVFNQVFDLGRPEIQNKQSVQDNLELWQELIHLIKQHNSFNHRLKDSNRQDLTEYDKLYRDCLYRR